MKDESLIKAKPFKNLSRKKALYIPCDTAKATIHSYLKKIRLEEKNLGFGSFFLTKNKIVLYQSIGAPAAVLSLERLIISGAKEIIILGFCGSLNPLFRTMETVIITKALSEEGTSRHYFPHKKNFYASPLLTGRIKVELHKKMLAFRTGSIVSTDAPYRETKSWLSQKQKKKIDFVDMECSAVFALAEFYRIQAAALMIISDELFSKKWEIRISDPELEEKIKQYFIPFI